ncbi:MAG: hypothetical protein ACYC9I_02555 [Desulfuromonadales bacterium]
MNADELLIHLNQDEIGVCVKVNGLDMQRAVLSREKGGEVLCAWLKNQMVGSIFARIQVAGIGDMRLALELAGMLASAGHTVSVGNIFRFMPAKFMDQEDFSESQPCQNDV